MAYIPKNYARLEVGYREKALKLFPWVCGRCSREFVYSNLRELTVHHIDHDHSNNPEDGSNWEMLCLYCHDHEHSKYTEADQYGSTVVAGEDAQKSVGEATYNPFADLKAMTAAKPQILRNEKPAARVQFRLRCGNLNTIVTEAGISPDIAIATFRRKLPGSTERIRPASVRTTWFDMKITGPASAESRSRPRTAQRHITKANGRITTYRTASRTARTHHHCGQRG